MKIKYSVLFTCIFMALGAAEIAAELMRNAGGSPLPIYITKPLLMPVLMAWMLANRRLFTGAFHRLVLVSLVFSMGGDVFLMFGREDLFMFGLASFLVAHLLYILGFAVNIRNAPAPMPPRRRAVIVAPFIAFAAGFMIFLGQAILENDTTRPMFLPVLVYATVIAMMGAFSRLRMVNTSYKSYWMIFCGALLFIVSDSLIAINKFMQPLEHASLWIMLTYLAAQYLIVKGTLWHQQPANKA